MTYLIRNFLWAKDQSNKGLLKVAWMIYTRPYLVGGLGIPHIPSQGTALTAKWFTRLFTSDELWKVLFKHRLQTPMARGYVVNNISWQNTFILAPHLSIKGCYVLKSLWKGWQQDSNPCNLIPW